MRLLLLSSELRNNKLREGETKVGGYTGTGAQFYEGGLLLKICLRLVRVYLGYCYALRRRSNIDHAVTRHKDFEKFTGYNNRRLKLIKPPVFWV